ncbi:hypothetical protein [Hyphomicrobium sp. ghe19]|uniref:hypothetical protein n=1 Tax=Hyphomicrobium sp. ghe19 TaxID=2682968 RepID=UPI00136759E5|nr:hypothetical protein HYPP_01183 [Hyphomicrobium sp. ghe19]
MLVSQRRAQLLLEYCILPNTEFQGPIIGRLDGRDFSEFVRDEFGRLFVYSGVAPRRCDGQFDQDALKAGEFIVLPGLIYRYRGKARRRAA